MFQDDWRPLSKAEVERGIELLGLTRQDLLTTVSNLDEDALNKKRAADSWSIDRVLNHVGNADRWYLDRLGLAQPRNDTPSETFERLKTIRDHLLEILPTWLIQISSLASMENFGVPANCSGAPCGMSEITPST